MAADYPLAQEHLVPSDFMFSSNACKAIVIHKTAGDATPQDVYNTFLASGNPGKSVHYAVGQDASIWQFVPEALGAGGNGITDGTMQAFWQPYVNEYGNLNLCTLSIEHCDPSPLNDTPLTEEQKQASFALVAYLAKKYNIAPDHVKPHNSICATDCPGNYPMDDLIAYLSEASAPAVQTERTTWVSQYQEQQAQAYWDSTTAKAVANGNAGTGGIFPSGQTPIRTTGIAKAWDLRFMNGEDDGPPITYELPTVDWNGKPIVAMWFAKKRCEWYVNIADSPTGQQDNWY